MKFFTALAMFFLAAGLLSAQAQQSADDQYLTLYGLIQQADTLANAGQAQPALSQYIQIQSQLERFQKIFPDWQPVIVKYRLQYLAEKIAALTPRVPAVTTNAIPTPTISPAEVEMASLRGQLQNLQTDNVLLTAKLKEALAAQPAMVDAGELAKAQAQIQSLSKENALLKSIPATTSTKTIIVADTNAQAQIQSLTQKNETLNKQIAALNAALPANSTSATKADADLKTARRQIAALQSEAQLRQLELTALEIRFEKLKTVTNAIALAPPSSEQAGNLASIRALTQERDELLGKLGEANKRLYGANKTTASAQIDNLTDQVRVLRARLAADEAAPVPYTPEELALFKQPAPLFANRDTEKKSIAELPAGSAELVAAAQAYFSAKQFDKAEAAYLQILRKDGKNPLVLANLAAIELEQNKLDEAETHVKAAIAQNPDDAYDLATLGYLKFRQEKYDEALDALSRAAKLDPQNPEIENYLGVTLSHKGLRTQAETALRTAIQLDPNYAAAHNNLAAIYISQTPPRVELARWHYQKALDAGQPRNPDLEKALGLDAGSVPVNPQ